MKTFNITKLFYNKFPYKLVLVEPGIAPVKGTLSQQRLLEKNLLALAKAVKENKDNQRVRREGRRYSFFFKDYSFFEKVVKKFHLLLIEFHRPANKDILNLLERNRRIEVKKSLPYECRYKIYIKTYIRPHDAQFDSIMNFVRNQGDKVILTNSVKRVLEKKSGYCPNSYFYVKDSKTLLMIQMLAQSIIKETIEFKIVDKEISKEVEYDEA